jgi:mRNA interferase RelE/StbE
MPDQRPKFTLVIARSFLKDLQKLDRPDQVRNRKALPEIQESPYRGRKIVSADIGQYRWRVGNYRIRYDIAGDEVHILRVIKREDVYRRF